jgi:mannose-6-phosphate isomerase-like protein (cupin superfamily)
VRHAERRPVWQAGVARLPYIGEGGAPPGQYRMDMVHLPQGSAVQGYARPVEEAYFVLEGCLTVGWEENGHSQEERLGPKDVILNPPGRIRYFRNDGLADAEFMLLVGTSQPEEVRFAP